MQSLKIALRPPHLPVAFSKDMRVEKMARMYAHVYDHYVGAGASGCGRQTVSR